MKNISYLFGILLSLSCSIQHNLKVNIEEDVVKNTVRASTKFLYSPFDFIGTSLSRLEQTVIKEIDSTQKGDLLFYDILTFEDESFRLKREVYLITQSQEVIKPDVIDFYKEHQSTIKEDKETMLSVDSVQHTYIAGYKEDNNKNYYVTYKLDNEQQNNILKTNTLFLRYYSGPEMITIQVNEVKLTRIKKVIAL